jgi:hypothetical protein
MTPDHRGIDGSEARISELLPGSEQARCFLASVVPLLDHAGKPQAVDIVLADATDPKEVEAQARRDADLRPALRERASVAA